MTQLKDKIAYRLAQLATVGGIYGGFRSYDYVRHVLDWERLPATVAAAFGGILAIIPTVLVLLVPLMIISWLSPRAKRILMETI